MTVERDNIYHLFSIYSMQNTILLFCIHHFHILFNVISIKINGVKILFFCKLPKYRKKISELKILASEPSTSLPLLKTFWYLLNSKEDLRLLQKGTEVEFNSKYSRQLYLRIYIQWAEKGIKNKEGFDQISKIGGFLLSWMLDKGRARSSDTKDRSILNKPVNYC